jgi:hypothetical protein
VKGPIWLSGTRTAKLGWDELAGYRDGSIDYVELIPRARRGRWPPLTIPTPTEELRTAVLRALDERGLARQD